MTCTLVSTGCLLLKCKSIIIQCGMTGESAVDEGESLPLLVSRQIHVPSLKDFKTTLKTF